MLLLHIMKLIHYDLTGAVIIAQQFPEYASNAILLETYALTCLFHDVATADEFLYGTNMSFDFYGAFIARDFLIKHEAVQDSADAVAEAILRHQDVEVSGTITFLGLIIQLTTLLGMLLYLLLFSVTWLHLEMTANNRCDHRQRRKLFIPHRSRNN